MTDYISVFSAIQLTQVPNINLGRKRNIPIISYIYTPYSGHLLLPKTKTK